MTDLATLKGFVARAQAAQSAVDSITGAGDDYTRLLLTLGSAMGLLAQPELRDRLVADLRGGTLSPGYVVTLRCALDDVLNAAAASHGHASR